MLCCTYLSNREGRRREGGRETRSLRALPCLLPPSCSNGESPTIPVLSPCFLAPRTTSEREPDGCRQSPPQARASVSRPSLAPQKRSALCSLRCEDTTIKLLKSCSMLSAKALLPSMTLLLLQNPPSYRIKKSNHPSSEAPKKSRLDLQDQSRPSQDPLQRRDLRGRLLEVRDQVLPVLLLLEAGEDHLGARDVLLRRLEVVEESVLFPRDARALVGLCVGRGVARDRERERERESEREREREREGEGEGNRERARGRRA